MQQFFEPFPTEHNQSQQISDAVTSDYVDALSKCPLDPFENKCPKECLVIIDDRGCSLCVCPSNHKTHDFEPNNIQGQQFPTEQHQSQSEVIEVQKVAPTQILSEDWSNLFLNRNFTFAEKSDEMNKSSSFEIIFDKEQSAAENETKSEVVEATYSSTNETDPNTIADEILSGEIENKGDVFEAEEQLLFENDVFIDPNDLFQSIKIQNDNETHGINNITFENGIDENHGHNETSNNEIQEGSSSIDNETFAEGSGNAGQKASVDDENGDAEDSDVTAFEENPTVEPKPKMIEMHKCLCTEIETCLTEIWGNEIFNYKETSDVNLLTKCSLTFLKSDCSNGFNPETKQIFANENNDDKIDTCSCTSDSTPLLFNKQMEKCMTKKSCFIQNHESIFKKMRPFCIEKVKKLAVLNSLKFSKDEILALKNEYLQTFDEEFEDAAKPHYSNIFSRWFYQMRNKFCETF
uniref:Uncharacterized protein n=1 Tax=Panagrolaimus davidi TaxID=227884 RepID=A0A914Q0W2_9BILA